jgi:hypothetical protein
MSRGRLAILKCLILYICLPAQLRSDGFFLAHHGHGTVAIKEPSQQALLYYGSGRETLVLKVAYEGVTPPAAWIVPLPVEPVVSVLQIDQDPFKELDTATRVPGPPPPGSRIQVEQAAQAEAVQVLQRFSTSVLDVAVLASTDSVSLSRWLLHHDFKVPAGAEAVLQEYGLKHWVFTAIRLKSRSISTKEVRVALPAIRFSFATPEPVFPLKISSINPGSTDLRLYTLADTMMESDAKSQWTGLAPMSNASFDTADRENGFRRRRSMANLSVTAAAVGLTPGAEMFLCRYEQDMKAEDLSQDLAFKPLDPHTYWLGVLSQTAGGADPANINSRRLAFCSLGPGNPDIFAQAAESGDSFLTNWAVRQDLRTLPADALNCLADDRDIWVRRNLAGNESAPPWIDDRLAHDSDRDVRSAVALRSGLPLDDLIELEGDSDISVVDTVLRNPRCPKNLLDAALSRNEHLTALAVNPSLTEDEWAVLLLKGDSNLPHILSRQRYLATADGLKQCLSQLGEETRTALADAIATYPILAGALANDPNSKVRAAAAAKVAMSSGEIGALAADTNPFVRLAVAQRLDLSPTVAGTLNNDPCPEIRRALAKQQGLGKDFLRAMANDQDREVRAAIAENSVSPDDVVAGFARDPDPLLRSRVAMNSAILFRQYGLVESLARDPDEGVRTAVASHWGANSVYPILAKDLSAAVRRAVAANICVSDMVLKALAMDGDDEVARAARAQQGIRVSFPMVGESVAYQVAVELNDIGKRIAVAQKAGKLDTVLATSLGERLHQIAVESVEDHAVFVSTPAEAAKVRAKLDAIEAQLPSP